MSQVKHILNYKYEIFPTNPQRKKINDIIFQCSVQWNKAVATRAKLHKALNLGQLDYIIQEFIKIKSKKNITQHVRVKAINTFAEKIGIQDRTMQEKATLSDLSKAFNRVLPITEKYLDIDMLIKDLTILFNKQKELSKNKRKVYYNFLSAINSISGEKAKFFMDSSFSVRGLAETRYNISGTNDSPRWKVATNPSKEQRSYGSKGVPNFKRARDYSSFVLQYKKVDKFIRPRKKGKGHLFNLKVLPKGMQEIKIKYHRELPLESTVKQINIKRDGSHYFATFSTQITEKDYAIQPPKPGLLIGIDPGAKTPLSCGVRDLATNTKANFKAEYSFMEPAYLKLEKLQQQLAYKQGTHRNKQELQHEINIFMQSPEYKKLNEKEQKQAKQKRLNYLQKERIRQKPSKGWLQLSNEIKEIYYHLRNQRKDVLDKISHSLVSNYEMISFGHWEPPREVSYRKKLKELKKMVKLNEPGAKKELKKLEESKTKNAHKGAKTIRKGGRDRSIATLKSKIEEKAKRSGAYLINQNESKTTIRCHVCRQETGPRQDLSVREWTCTNCGTKHDRDSNSSFEIMNKSIDTLVVQTRSSAHKGKVNTNTRILDQETMSPILRSFLEEVQGKGHVGEVFPCCNGMMLDEKLLKKDVSSMKSLVNMGVAVTPENEKCINM